MRELELMGTLGCHLCDDAAQLIMVTLDPNLFAVYQVDIAEDDELMEKYAVRIPVLLDVSSQAELGWPFDQAQLQEFVATLPAVS